MFGIALSHQSTPAQHPRLLITTSSGQARGGGDILSSRSTNISDDIFSWNGNDLQLIVMQQLPLELVATAFYDHSSRDYGQMTATVNGRTAKLQNRTDKRGTFGLSLSREFFLGESSLHYLSVGLSYGSVSNSSTNFTRRALPIGDYDFNFSEHFVALNVQWAMY
jgi:hypothetical protein